MFEQLVAFRTAFEWFETNTHTHAEIEIGRETHREMDRLVCGMLLSFGMSVCWIWWKIRKAIIHSLGKWHEDWMLVALSQQPTTWRVENHQNVNCSISIKRWTVSATSSCFLALLLAQSIAYAALTPHIYLYIYIVPTIDATSVFALQLFVCIVLDTQYMLIYFFYVEMVVWTIS